LNSIPYKNLIITIVLFLAIILVRFNGNQSVVKQQPYDTKYFKAYVEYFRGQTPSEPLRPATNWRFLIPLIASKLPFNAITAINLINVLFLGFSLFIFYNIQTLLTIPNRKKWINIWLFICSFPTFYYTTIGYIDASLFLFIALSIYATLKQNGWVFATAILLGLCVKETIIIAAPFYFIFHLKNSKKNGLKTTIFTGILSIILLFIIKHYAPVTDFSTKDNFWKFGTENAFINFYRFNTWFSFIASFGVIGLLIILNLKNILNTLKNNYLLLACCACFLVAIALYVLSYFATVADGRIIWLIYFYLLIAISSSQKENPDNIL
jgi:hypothetical protein